MPGVGYLATQDNILSLAVEWLSAHQYTSHTPHVGTLRIQPVILT